MQRLYNISVLPGDNFIDAIPVLYAPFEKYVVGVIPLMLEHVWQQKNSSSSNTAELLMKSGWIGRLITLDKRVLDVSEQNNIEGWPKLRGNLIDHIDNCRSSDDVNKMVASCMLLIAPLLEKRFKHGYTFPVRPFHSWWYTIHNDNKELALHLVNAYQPASPFDNLDHFLQNMLKAVEHAIKLYPGINKVSCGSWLNGVPKFQQLWPKSFTQNQRILNKSNGFGPGAWGQYMTLDGGFNSGKSNILRKTGLHPYVLTEAHSPLEEVLSHLGKIIANPTLINHE